VLSGLAFFGIFVRQYRQWLTGEINPSLQETIKAKEVSSLRPVAEPKCPHEINMLLHHRAEMTGKTWDRPEGIQRSVRVRTQERLADAGPLPFAITAAATTGKLHLRTANKSRRATKSVALTIATTVHMAGGRVLIGTRRIIAAKRGKSAIWRGWRSTSIVGSTAADSPNPGTLTNETGSACVENGCRIHREAEADNADKATPIAKANVIVPSPRSVPLRPLTPIKVQRHAGQKQRKPGGRLDRRCRERFAYNHERCGDECDRDKGIARGPVRPCGVRAFPAQQKHRAAP
jgi:hypothetical protein